MKENNLSVTEIVAVRKALLGLWRISTVRPSMAEARRLAQFLQEYCGAEIPRDVFGRNKLEHALQSVVLASSEIGLRGKVLMAYVLWQLCGNAVEAVGKAYGEDVAALLQSFQRVASLDVKPEAMQTDNFRNLLVGQAGDMRVVLLLIADCVYAMRSVKGTENIEEQKKLSLEAAYIYAPLAHKLGLYRLKSELEDLSLKYLEHDAYYMIKEELNATKKSRDAYIERFLAPIKEMLDQEGLHYHMKGRTKSIHSIWQKMKKQQCGFKGVYDLFAIRIILDAPLEKEKEQCWKVFSLITNQYESNLKRLRDWLTVPKSNGYESLHVTVKGPEEKWVEVQIRTERMDEVAERGLAAHWRYKGVKSSGGTVDSWLADIRSALETGNEDLLTNSLTTDSDAKDVYVFSPKGDLYHLPPGATVLDFAYHIHTGVGNRCVGGRINGRNVPIRHKLESGVMVEVLTSTQQTPKAEWQNIVVSSHAKAKIRAAVKDTQAGEIVLAREFLERKLKNRKIDWDESIINQLVKKAGFKESMEFYRAIADERIDMNHLIEMYVELGRKENNQLERAGVRSAGEFNFEKEVDRRAQGEGDVLVIDRNLKGLDFQMARCCNPVYGDDVFGFVTVSGGIKIHRTNCPNAAALRERFGYRIVAARWAGKGGGKYPITLNVVGNDDLGIVNNITSIISKEERIMLRSISIDSNDGLFSGILTVMVDDTQVLNVLMKKLRTVKGVKAVSRF
ncbi:MAG: bifunctional (p)ppGpp synthetase/guanosine-3',5'-bis(diphosphate) 3'-pyrophosphohydrolase [Bacteroidaceae bacterium]|nr:bifunctional (p)ppGpp synthetase/guanosine-3',5'-bis(diphosphate) 3'-pyrophosphohydrolase [Bacteroidaceae bacterium]